jgi:GlpG protein
MRLIGYLAEESAARTFGDYLLVQGIENKIEAEREGWGVWVSDEDRIVRAVELLALFRKDPADPRYRSEAAKAERLRDKAEKVEEDYRKRVRNRRHLFRPLTGYGFGAFTFVLIAFSVAVFFLSRYGNEPERIMALFITDFSGGVFDRGLPEIRRGEIWRVFTPMFIHFGPLHIIFNLLWLRDLGSMIEGRQTSWHLAIIVLVIAAASNLLQFYFGGPVFGGMSGVVYGLLGYIWLRGKFDPGSGLYLHSSTVTMMLVWFFICLLGLIPRIANTAHAVGLILGMAWGYISSLRYH